MGDALIGVVLFFGMQLGAGVLIAVVLVATGGWDGAGEEMLEGGQGTLLLVLAAPLGWAVLIGWPWWVSRHKGTGRLSRDFGLSLRRVDVLLGLAGGLLCLLTAAAVSLLYAVLAGEEAPTNTDIIDSDPSRPGLFVVLFLVIAVGTPIAEEIFFRGLVLGAARKRWGTPLAVVFSSVLFGLFHVQGDLLAWAFVALVTGSYGAVFALLRVWADGRIAAPIVAHMLVNGTAVVLVTYVA